MLCKSKRRSSICRFSHTGAGSNAAHCYDGFTFTPSGLVHGLQPDALLVIIPTLALPKVAAVRCGRLPATATTRLNASQLADECLCPLHHHQISYLFTYMLGTVVAMASYTVRRCSMCHENSDFRGVQITNVVIIRPACFRTQAFIGAGTEKLSRRSPGMTRRISLLSALLVSGNGHSPAFNKHPAIISLSDMCPPSFQAIVIGVLIEVSLFFPDVVPFL